jgi:hypothetical protein
MIPFLNEHGVVNLSRVVETAEQRARAERLAHQVEGVVRVNNNLQIQNRLPSKKTDQSVVGGTALPLIA